MATILGLDLGTNSIGWALLKEYELGKPPVELHAGVYVFPEPGELTNNERVFVSNRLKRGQTRRQRRQLRRRRQRMRHVTRLLIEHGLLPADPVARMELMSKDRDQSGGRPYHPFMLRKRGLDEELSLHEFGRCLHHIARRRGYLSTRDLMRRTLEESLGLDHVATALLEEGPNSDATAAEEEQKERSKLLARLREVRERIRAGEARTIGEFCADRLAQRTAVRATGKRKKGRQARPDTLGWRADRFMHEEEFERLWDAQSRFHPGVLTSSLHDQLFHAIFSQRPLASKRGLIGPCQFLPSRKRLARASLLAQRCSILQSLVNVQLQESAGWPIRRLTGDEVGKLADELDRRDRLSWDDAKTVLGLSKSAQFSNELEGKGRTKRKTGGFTGNKTAAAMREALGADRWHSLPPEVQESLVDCLLYAHDPGSMGRSLRRRFGLTDDEVRMLAAADLPEGYTGHCSRVWKDLEPLMRSGKTYREACEEAGYVRAGESSEAPIVEVVDRLGAMPDVRNPVVQRAVAMAFKVINAVIEKHGKPDKIRIEMPRDVSRTNKQREEIWRRQDENRRRNEAALKLLSDHQLPSGENAVNIKKVRLWEEAGMRSPYEPHVQVTLKQLVEEYEIDHIVPRSRSLDNSWTNLTICSRGQNMEKGDRTPYEWLGGTRQWSAIETAVRTMRAMPPAKRNRILAKEWDFEEFTNRALSDTRYLSRVIKNEVAKLGVEVEVSTGQLTALLRDRWELRKCLPESEKSPTPEEETESIGGLAKTQSPAAKKVRLDHRHHALDAIVTALTDRATVQRLTAYLKAKETGRDRDLPTTKPWPTIAEDLKERMLRIPVVHASNRRVEGALHKETAQGTLPSKEQVEAALAAIQPRGRRRARRAVVIGKQLVRLLPDGTPFAAYDLESNHHAVIWERETPDETGCYPRDITIVPMIEAARRAVAGEPVVRRTRDDQPGWRFVMSLCKGDIVEWKGEKPGWKKVAAFSLSGTAMDIHLMELQDSQKDMGRVLRVRTRRNLSCIARRLRLSPLGDIVGTEPADAVR